MTVGVYYPFQVFAGGGEKYLLKLVQILSADHHVEILSPFDNDYVATAAFLNIQLNPARVHAVSVQPNLLTNAWRDICSMATKRYDLFIAISNSVMPDTAGLGRKNIYLLQFPFPTTHPINPLQRLLIRNRANTYQVILAYSEFAKRWIDERLNKAFHLNRRIEVLNPYLDSSTDSPATKKNMILSVGRFFAGGHNKKHLEMIDAFRTLCDNGLTSWELVLAGSTRPEAVHQEYLEHLRERAKGYPISFQTDIAHQQLTTLYQTSKIYWHATGLNEDAEKLPEKMEHFGMTIVEAMSYSCVPIVYGQGGPVEIVTNDVNGQIFHSAEELASTTQTVINNPELWKKYSDQAKYRAQDFNESHFTERFQKILASL